MFIPPEMHGKTTGFHFCEPAKGPLRSLELRTSQPPLPCPINWSLQVRIARLFALTAVAICCIATTSYAQEATKTTRSLFNGETLEGWKGREDLWKVEDGAIVGTSTKENPLKGNTFLIYGGELPGNFELSAQFLIEGGNSGIQYRSKVMDEKEFVVGGYQADIDSALQFAGINYEERGRGILALRGEKVEIAANGEKSKETFGDAAEIGKVIKAKQWNDYRVVANGIHLQHYINDTLTSEVIDHQSDKAAKDGVIALQLHAGPPMVVRFKNIQIRELKD